MISDEYEFMWRQRAGDLDKEHHHRRHQHHREEGEAHRRGHAKAAGVRVRSATVDTLHPADEANQRRHRVQEHERGRPPPVQHAFTVGARPAPVRSRRATSAAHTAVTMDTGISADCEPIDEAGETARPAARSHGAQAATKGKADAGGGAESTGHARRSDSSEIDTRF